jgi:hypothetical protein
MSSYRASAVRVLRLRVKDKHAAWLCGLAREVNTVFNYCNELSVKVFERERRFLSGFDFWPFLKGATRGDCALHLPVQAVQEIAEEYARRPTASKSATRVAQERRCADLSVGFPSRSEPFATEPDRSTSRDGVCRSGTATVSVTLNFERETSAKTAAGAGI